MMDKNSLIYNYEPLWGVWKVDGLITQGSYGDTYKVYKEERGKRYESAVKLISISIGQSDIKEAQAVGIDPFSMPEYFKSFVSNIINEVEVMYKLFNRGHLPFIPLPADAGERLGGIILKACSYTMIT